MSQFIAYMSQWISALRSIFCCSEDPEPLGHFGAEIGHSDLRCQTQANMASDPKPSTSEDRADLVFDILPPQVEPVSRNGPPSTSGEPRFEAEVMRL